MSLIHEALKKAEQQRRLGEPPGLATPFARSPRQRSLLPYLAAAIVVALGAGWFLTRDTTAPEKDASAKTDSKTAAATPVAASGAGTPAAPGTDPASANSAAERHPVMGANAAASAPAMTALAPPPRLNSQAPASPPTFRDAAERESEPHPPGATPPAPGETVPLNRGASPPEAPVNASVGLASKMAVTEKEPGADAAPPTPAADGSPFIGDRPDLPPAHAAKSPGPATSAAAPMPPGGATGFVPPETNATAVPPPLTPPANAFATAAAPPTAAPAVAPPLEQLPVYWQLPYNVRKELPDLKMSMHVYSETPAQRFVVLNGNRQVEGDELGGEVRVSEIRRDGVVLVFQGQRFIVPRGGS